MTPAARALVLGAAVLAAAGLGACSADEVANSQCPLLCPQRNLQVVDTTLEAVVLDTVLPGFPVLGTEPRLLVATAPGGLDVRGLIRFDSTVTTFAPTFADTLRPITAPDSVRIEVRVDSAVSRATAPFTIEAYDVDTTVVDTATAALAQHFRPEKLLGTATFQPDSLRDTLRVPITNVTRFVAALRDFRRVRVGLRVVSSGSAQLLIGTNDGFREAKLRYRPAVDSGLPTITLPPRSGSPSTLPDVAAALSDFTWVVSGTADPPATELALGGAPGRRTYVGIDLPTRIVDSSDVLRATLELTQRPYTGPRLRDTLAVFPWIVVAGANADIRRSTTLAVGGVNALRVSLGQRSFTDSLRMAVRDSGVRRFDITAAVREWRLSGPNGMRRALVLRIGQENYESGELRFFSREAAAGLRPRIRVVYNAGRGTGLP
jgi:hypothetical protein